MRAVTFNFNEKIFKFQENAKVPKAGKGDALIKVKAASINPVEMNHALWSSMVDEGKRDEFVMGVDVAGVIETV